MFFYTRIFLSDSHFGNVGRTIDPAEKLFRPIGSVNALPPDFKFKFPCNRISRQKSRLIHLVGAAAAEPAQSAGPNYE